MDVAARPGRARDVVSIVRIDAAIRVDRYYEDIRDFVVAFGLARLAGQHHHCEVRLIPALESGLLRQ